MKKNCKRILAMVMAIMMLLPVLSTTPVSATETGVSDVTALLNALNNAKDGDVVKLASNITMVGGGNHTGDCFTVPENCLVTLDLNGKTLAVNNTGSNCNNFGIGANSALIVKNGTVSGGLDTNNDDEGTLILSSVSVEAAWLGETKTWVVNGSSIGHLETEYGSINEGAANLNPVLSGYMGSYSYANPAPAMIGSGTTWECPATLKDNFDMAEPTTYKNIILLKDSTLQENATLAASGINFNLAGYTLTTGDKTLTIGNDADTNTICNGTIKGDIKTDGFAGAINLSNLTVTGEIKNGGHNLTVESGFYNSINNSTGTVKVKDGYYTGVFSGPGYEITGGEYVIRQNINYAKSGYTFADINDTVNSVTYKYKLGLFARIPIYVALAEGSDLPESGTIFSFELKADDASYPLPETTKISFDAPKGTGRAYVVGYGEDDTNNPWLIEFKEEGVYTYTITQTDIEKTGMKIDNGEWKVNIVVDENGAKVITLTSSYRSDVDDLSESSFSIIKQNDDTIANVIATKDYTTLSIGPGVVQSKYIMYVDEVNLRLRMVGATNGFCFGMNTPAGCKDSYGIVAFPVPGISLEMFCLTRNTETEKKEIKEYIELLKEELSTAMAEK